MRTYVIEDYAQIEKIIKSCRTCYLGVCGSDMKPYVIPMNFGMKDDVLYLHSGQFGRKWEAIRQNPNVCVTFCLGDEIAWQDEHIACSYRVKSESVIAEGKIEFIDDYEEKIEALNILMGQYSQREFKYNAPAVKNVGVMKMKIESLGAKEFGAKALTPWNS
jgi:uncharacterized protein